MPGGAISYARFNASIDAAAHFLSRAGARSLGGVSVGIANPYLHWVMVLAVWRLGGSVLPAGESAPDLRIVLEGEGRSELSLSPQEVERLLSGDSAPFPGTSKDAAAPAYLLQSSGTTGDPKRVELSYGLLDARVRGAFVAYGAPQGPWLATTGIATALGLVVSLACWAAGNPLILPPRPSLEARALLRWRPSLVACIPGQLRTLVEALPDELPKWPLRVVAGGGAVPPALLRKARDRLTPDIRSVYGASETGSVGVATASLLEARRGTAGYILPDVAVDIVDDEGHPLPPETIGEIRIRGERVVDRYLDDPDLSRQAFRDGSFYTRDLGLMTALGELVVLGRKDDLMNLGGRKLLPEPIETAACASDGIRDAAACSVVDSAGFETCWLAVVAEDPIDEARVLATVAKAIGWLPRIRTIALPTIPRNAMGKIDRPRLRDIIGKRDQGGKSS